MLQRESSRKEKHLPPPKEEANVFRYGKFVPSTEYLVPST